MLYVAVRVKEYIKCFHKSQKNEGRGGNQLQKLVELKKSL